jgi:transcriptional regulator with XRE-family HTH domain
MMTLQSILKAKGLRQAALADHLGVSEPSVSRWATRGADIPARYIGPIAAFLDVPVTEVLAVAVQIAPPATAEAAA